MDENGHQGMPIWITEFGFSKPPAEQAQRLIASLSWFAAHPYIELACLHMLHDQAGDDPPPADMG